MRGCGLLAGVAALVALIMLLGYRELAVPAVAAAAAIISGAATIWRRPRVEITRRVVPVRVHRGGEAHAEIEVRAVGRRCPAFQVRFEVGRTPVRADVPALGRKSRYVTAVGLPTAQRGVHVVGAVTIHQEDRFGLWRRDTTISVAPETLRVMPAVVLAPVPPATTAAAAEGPTRENSPEGGNTFHALREYVPGDDLRYVHWRASARSAAGLRVRRYVDPVPLTVTVLLDLYRGAYASPADAETAIEVAASVLMAAVQHRREALLLTTTATPAPGGSSLPGSGGFLDLLTVARLHDDPRRIQAPGLIQGPRAGHSGLVTVLTGTREAPPEVLTGLIARYQRAVVLRLKSGPAGERAEIPSWPSSTRMTVADAASVPDALRLWARALSAGRQDRR
ncbi:DUF58 domain-containing protein [Actinoplanes rectilineatus]|uniref:DUF58 domain-containing protein n=1 Tax=Actinoplanes rectilineatus TaxID=113571 RepID=UPI0012FA90EE|nr:DUF58 domain-containing protein [Actinoplanes rectilineatus]